MEENKDIIDFIDNNSWMVRQCILYKEEYKDCKSLKSRFHQRFVYGAFVNCSQWNRDYCNCISWKEENNNKAFKELIASEDLRRKERINAHNKNDVWTKRESPPTGWSDPLPQWMQERLNSSYLSVKASEIKDGNTGDRTFCVIM